MTLVSGPVCFLSLIVTLIINHQTKLRSQSNATTAVLSRNNSLCLCLLYSAKWLIYWCKRVNNKAELPITGRYINTEYMVSNWSQIYWYRIYGFKADLPHHRYITEYIVLKLFSSDNFIMTTSISEIVSFSTLRSMVTNKLYYQIIMIPDLIVRLIWR